MSGNTTANYLSLLKIRQEAYRRNVTITGGIFLVTFLATIMFGMLSQMNGLSIYLIAGFNVAFLMSFLMAWVRLEIVKANIDLLNNL
jgi:hypothetical protein